MVKPQEARQLSSQVNLTVIPDVTLIFIGFYCDIHVNWYEMVKRIIYEMLKLVKRRENCEKKKFQTAIPKGII